MLDIEPERFERTVGDLLRALSSPRKDRAETALKRGGERLTIEPGTAHKFWNAGENELRLLPGSARTAANVNHL